MNSITRDATDMYLLFDASDGYPAECSDNCIICDVHEAQHYRYAYYRSASFCSYIKQNTALIYRRICKIKYCKESSECVEH